jgi:hypothetical protein
MSNDNPIRYDVLIYYDDGPHQPVRPRLFRGPESSLVISGIRGLAQRYLIELFTQIGTLQGLPDRGTRLFNDILHRNLRTTYDIVSFFAAANAEAINNLRRESRADDPPDEIIKDARLIHVEIDQTRLVLHIEIESEAGLTQEIRAPIPAVA